VSWDEVFAARYEKWTAGTTADVEFLIRLAGETDGPVVKLAIGNGRVAIPVAEAIDRPVVGRPVIGRRVVGRPFVGRRVVGVDTSPEMLAQARERAAAAGVGLELHEGDMRDSSSGARSASRTSRMPVRDSSGS
jgi:ubiquinone/menaquinone biosynthesis C-methylase UbiE